MFILTAHNKRWRIEKDNQVVLSGIGTVEQAIAISKRYGLVLSELKHIDYLKAA